MRVVKFYASVVCGETVVVIEMIIVIAGLLREEAYFEKRAN